MADRHREGTRLATRPRPEPRAERMFLSRPGARLPARVEETAQNRPAAGRAQQSWAIFRFGWSGGLTRLFGKGRGKS